MTRTWFAQKDKLSCTSCVITAGIAAQAVLSYLSLPNAQHGDSCGQAPLTRSISRQSSEPSGRGDFDEAGAAPSPEAPAAQALVLAAVETPPPASVSRA